MMFKQTLFPRTHIPEELLLRLIKQELRERKLFQKESATGFPEHSLYPSFSWLLLNTLGINPIDDKNCRDYFAILDQHVNKISKDGEFEEEKEVLRKVREVAGGKMQVRE
jgi:hypothetical protein